MTIEEAVEEMWEELQFLRESGQLDNWTEEEETTQENEAKEENEWNRDYDYWRDDRSEKARKFYRKNEHSKYH